MTRARALAAALVLVLLVGLMVRTRAYDAPGLTAIFIQAREYVSSLIRANPDLPAGASAALQHVVTDFDAAIAAINPPAPPPPPPVPPPPPPPSSSGGDAASFGIWNPSARDTCTKAQHDAYAVVGPDGKRYPTWHPPTGPNGCTFGHEHGRNPQLSSLWAQIQAYFAFDANGNGTLEADEVAAAGIPFGYTNEHLDVYVAARGQSTMRHEDHVGHKIEWADNEQDIATDQHGPLNSGGVRVQRNKPFLDTGARCRFLAKVHQGVSSPDAFVNNLHEVMYFASCTHANPSFVQRLSVMKLAPFGRPGGFNKFMPLCGSSRRESPLDFLFLGLDAMNQNYPTGPGVREIITRDCVEFGFLVASGFSGNLYEAWPTMLAFADTQNRLVATGINLLFDVEDANRYYYPEAQKAARGYTVTPAPTFSSKNLGMSMDLCYEQLGSRRARGGPCDAATNFGAIRGITWDDPRSAFKGVHRGMYFMPAVLTNAGGPPTWYTDPFGGNGQATPFPGSLRQDITPATMNYSSLIGTSIDPRVSDRIHDDGGRTVHAPN